MKVLRAASRRRVSLFRAHRVSIIVGAAALALLLVLALCARFVGGFAEGYAQNVYPWLVATLGRFFGWFPFSVFEVLAVLLLVLLLALLIRLIVRMVRGRGSRGRLLFGAAARFLSFLLCLALLYTAACGVNYHRVPFSAYSGLTVQKSDAGRLTKLCEKLAGQLEQLAPRLETDENGLSKSDGSVGDIAVAAMRRLGERYSVLQGFYPQPKPVLASVLMSYANITGIYVPFTVEANYNRDTVAYTIPVTVCHELSHLRGFMREDEANFIGYLACAGSENDYFAYSGVMLAYVYAMNALWSAGDQEAYRSISAGLPELCRKDLQANDAYWKRFETPVAQLSTQVNDAYLQANGQTDGVRSYGRFVDLLLAYYFPPETN